MNEPACAICQTLFEDEDSRTCRNPHCPAYISPELRPMSDRPTKQVSAPPDLEGMLRSPVPADNPDRDRDTQSPPEIADEERIKRSKLDTDAPPPSAPTSNVYRDAIKPSGRFSSPRIPVVDLEPPDDIEVDIDPSLLPPTSSSKKES